MDQQRNPSIGSESPQRLVCYNINDKQKQSATCGAEGDERYYLHFVQNLFAQENIERIEETREDSQYKTSIE